MKLDIGSIAHHIQDYDETHISDIPFIVAIVWACDIVGESYIGFGKTFADIDAPHQWLNDMFVVVSKNPNQWIVICNCDGIFSIRSINIRKFKN